jgi:hypothetical protein
MGLNLRLRLDREEAVQPGLPPEAREGAVPYLSSQTTERSWFR